VEHSRKIKDSKVSHSRTNPGLNRSSSLFGAVFVPATIRGISNQLGKQPNGSTIFGGLRMCKGSAGDSVDEWILFD